MASTREKLIDWLADLPDDTQIGIEDEDLVAIINAEAYLFEVGGLPEDALQINLEAFSGTRRK
jgi:hypothetical protein